MRRVCVRRGTLADLRLGRNGRGTGITALSDIDLLIIVQDRPAVQRLGSFNAAFPHQELSIAVHDELSFAQLRTADWSSVDHLAREYLPAFGDARTG
jgi:hypothetical protein